MAYNGFILMQKYVNAGLFIRILKKYIKDETIILDILEDIYSNEKVISEERNG
jgi:hypothetical protein